MNRRPRFNPLPLATLLACGLFITACSRGDGTAVAATPTATAVPPASTPAPATPARPAIDPEDRSQYRYLYAVYCNGVVDRLDLAQRTKVGSFHLSDRSGSPRAVAALPGVGVKPGTCLARPVVTGDTRDHAAGVVHIVASDRLDPGGDGQARFRLLTYALPAWKLQDTRDLGSFDVLNDAPPRMVRAADGSLAVQPRAQRTPDGSPVNPPPAGSQPDTELARQVQGYAGAQALEFPKAVEWSAGNVLLDYALPDQAGTGVALASQADKKVVRVGEFRKALPAPDRHLAPGGRFVLLTLQRSVRLGKDQHKIEATGELRLHGADGQPVATLTEPAIAGRAQARAARASKASPGPLGHGDWFHIALTPDGLAVFTDRRGNYHFVALGQTFGVAPVADAATDDLEGARPGIVYAAE